MAISFDRRPLVVTPMLPATAMQLGDVADLVALGLALGDRLQGEGQVAAVVGVGGRAGGDGAGQVAGGDRFDGRAADADLAALIRRHGPM